MQVNKVQLNNTNEVQIYQNKIYSLHYAHKQ